MIQVYMLIELNKRQIITLKDNQIIHIGSNFMKTNTSLVGVSMNSVTSIGDNFLPNNKTIVNISLDSVLTLGAWCLSQNTSLTAVSIDNTTNLKTILINNVVTIRNSFLSWNSQVNKNGQRINNIELYVNKS